MGLGIQGTLRGVLGNRDRQIMAAVFANRFLTTYLTYRVEAFSEKRFYDYYEDLGRTGAYSKTVSRASVSLGQHMRRLGILSLKLGAENIRLLPIEGMSTPVEKLTLVHLTLRSEVDTRDRIPFPEAGKHHILEYEYSARFLGSKTGYYRLFTKMESYYPVWKGVVFHSRLCWGTSDMTTPFAKRFPLGGLNSFMGLPEKAQVGRRYICSNLEVRARIPWPKWIDAYASLRYDFGGIWERYAKISTQDFKHGIGAVLSLHTPLGPVSAGYGRMSDGYSRFYFSAGTQF